MNKNFAVGGFQINEYSPCFIIAEAGVNHNGNVRTALELVKKAKEVGANCVKFQTFQAKAVITRGAPKAEYQLKVTDPRETQFDMLKRLELSRDSFRAIVDFCKEVEIQFLSTPYNKNDVELLSSLDVDAFKIASGQIIEHSFLKYVAEIQKPMILSTGMATFAEIDEAIRVISSTGNEQLVLLQCTTNYPSLNVESNIRAMQSMSHAFDILAGYSDHVPNNFACYAAVSLGARVIEKHFTLDKNMEGPDHKASLDVVEFRELVQGVRLTELSLGSPIKQPSESEKRNSIGMRRSITAVVDIKKGDIIGYEMIDYKRPGTGLLPKFLEHIVNREAKIDIPADTQISFDMINW